MHTWPVSLDQRTGIHTVEAMIGARLRDHPELRAMALDRLRIDLMRRLAWVFEDGRRYVVRLCPVEEQPAVAWQDVALRRSVIVVLHDYRDAEIGEWVATVPAQDDPIAEWATDDCRAFRRHKGGWERIR